MLRSRKACHSTSLLFRSSGRVLTNFGRGDTHIKGSHQPLGVVWCAFKLIYSGADCEHRVSPAPRQDSVQELLPHLPLHNRPCSSSMSLSKAGLLLAAVLLAFAAVNAPLAAAQSPAVEACLDKAEAKFQQEISRAATQLTASSAMCRAAALIPSSEATAQAAAVPAAGAQVAAADAPLNRPGCGRGCQYGLCVARCYIDRISIYPSRACTVYDCPSKCRANVNYKCKP
ncbi:hypothetical protein OEZ85_005335 [Tetradesmus obliquus]|uniref:Uncharacterized protein n=1 Tax=Tetradesmus obliquus TaxID=3088 RepID=A0ABY8UHZ9_TETOB|nr:hypothetical protein OEZ85_005335 [Tetradesmus obliquus]